MTDYAQGSDKDPELSPDTESDDSADLNQKPPLELFLEEIKRLTGMEVCLYDLNFFLNGSPRLMVPSQLMIHNCDYCHFIKSNPEAFARCIETENWRTEQAAKIDHPLVDTCHAGVTDIILPVKVDREQIGAVFFGQVFTDNAETREKTWNDLVDRYGFSRKELEKKGATVPVTSSENLQSVHPLLRGIVDYLEIAEQLERLQKEKTHWHQGKAAYDSMPIGTVKIEELPTPLLERVRVAAKKEGNQSIRRAIRLVRSSYWKNPTAREISREVGMSESHFSREFRRIAGMTYRQCLLETRLNAAFYLIKRNGYSIEEAALLVGYEDGSSLQRAFKNFTGLTPRQFMRFHPRAFLLERFEINPSQESPLGKKRELRRG